MEKEYLVERKEVETMNGVAVIELWKNEYGEYTEMYRDPVSGYWTEL